MTLRDETDLIHPAVRTRTEEPLRPRADLHPPDRVVLSELTTRGDELASHEGDLEDRHPVARPRLKTLLGDPHDDAASTTPNREAPRVRLTRDVDPTLETLREEDQWSFPNRLCVHQQTYSETFLENGASRDATRTATCVSSFHVVLATADGNPEHD